MPEAPKLRRRLSLPLVVLYGLGTTIGAGIYVLVGKVAGEAGLYAPISFLLAAAMAGLTAFSFAELSSRHPRAAGAAIYVFEGLRTRVLAMLTGFAVVLAATVSAAAIVQGFAGYIAVFLAAPPWLWVLVLVAGLGGLAAWGIVESVSAAALLTLVEIAGLVLVIAVAGPSFALLPDRGLELLPPFESVAWLGILSGSVLAFYAFLGFEDMVNIVEEVKDARTALPRAIGLTLAVTTVLYVAVSLVAVLSLPPAALAESEAPLALLYREASGEEPFALGAIGALAVVNGALIQIILASRVFYGLAVQGWLPRPLARVHRTTATPLHATVLASALVLGFALALPLVTLAEATSLITLLIFAAVNLSLVVIKRRAPRPPGLAVVYPLWVPAAGFLVSLGFALFQIGVALLPAIGQG